MNASVLNCSASTAVAPAGDWPWLADLGNGNYRNPIIYADYSDPDVVRVGDDYWLTASSFNCTPGLPILHSRDLVNWRLVNYALNHVPHPRYEAVQPGCGVWAPAIRHHAGKYWIFFPTPDEGIYVITADHPAGQWSEPHRLQAGRGLIDPCPLWDDDGKAYLVHAYAGSRAGIKHRLRVCPMAPDASKLLGEGQIVFHEPEKHPTLEGPKFFKKDGWYYILAPAGGVATGWQVVMRSRNIFGPYEDKIVLAQGRTEINGPHQGALVDTPGGEWWFIHFQDAGLYGRILHLQPVRWQDGWPLMGTPGPDSVGEPVREHAKPALPPEKLQTLAASDTFSQPKLGLQWQWNANYRDEWFSLAARPGWLRLHAQPLPEAGLENAAAVLLQKFPARQFTVETKVEAGELGEGDEAGLVVMGREHAAIAIQKSGPGYKILQRQNGAVTCWAEVSQPLVRLKVKVRAGGKCDFVCEAGNLPPMVSPTTFQATPGVWIGARIGLYALRGGALAGGHADFNYFRFDALD